MLYFAIFENGGANIQRSILHVLLNSLTVSLLPRINDTSSYFGMQIVISVKGYFVGDQSGFLLSIGKNSSCGERVIWSLEFSCILVFMCLSVCVLISRSFSWCHVFVAITGRVHFLRSDNHHRPTSKRT